jgi:hypothetical protein
MKQKGFLIVLSQPATVFEEEFNAWYDSEHIPERLAVPGFETARRYVSVSGTPRYLVIYDLADAQVLESAEYRKVSFDNFSPWTRRVTSRARIYRSAGVQVHPGTALTKTAAWLLLLRFRSLPSEAGPAIVAGMQASFDGLEHTIQLRVFAHQTDEGFDFLGVVEARAPMQQMPKVEAFGGYADALDLVNAYTPY